VSEGNNGNQPQHGDKTMESITKHGHTYINLACLSFSDYSGSLVSVANIKAICEDSDFEDSIYEMSYGQWEKLDKWGDEFTSQAVVDDFKCSDPPMVVKLWGSHGSNCLWLLECEATEDIIACLSDYPLLDDCLHSELEIDAEHSAWDSWIRADLYATLEDSVKELADNMTDDQLFTCYRKAMETENEYPINEQGDQVWVDVKRIEVAYNNTIVETN